MMCPICTLENDLPHRDLAACVRALVKRVHELAAASHGAEQSPSGGLYGEMRMRSLTLSQWNVLWFKGNGGCAWQGVDKSEALTHVEDGRFREVVKIGDGSTVPMFGVVSTARVDDILEGRI